MNDKHFGEWLNTAIKIEESGIHFVDGLQEEFLNFVENAISQPQLGELGAAQLAQPQIKKPYHLMTSEEQREFKIERFGYDPTIGSKCLGTAYVLHKNKNEEFDFYLKANNDVDICYTGCNGNYLSGKYNPENKTLVGTPKEFVVPFFDLLEKNENG
jgi:hypothetical protein